LYSSYITYKECPHLDRKHTVFGKVVGGLETLDKMEAVPTGAKDKPKVRARPCLCAAWSVALTATARSWLWAGLTVN